MNLIAYLTARFWHALAHHTRLDEVFGPAIDDTQDEKDSGVAIAPPATTPSSAAETPKTAVSIDDEITFVAATPSSVATRPIRISLRIPLVIFMECNIFVQFGGPGTKADEDAQGRTHQGNSE